ncbi:MAG: hypothetical protein LBF89_02605 [Bacteroidales bacterium]|nr:hypothetical protein [Bacteroidales bacterium]
MSDFFQFHIDRPIEKANIRPTSRQPAGPLAATQGRSPAIRQNTRQPSNILFSNVLFNNLAGINLDSIIPCTGIGAKARRHECRGARRAPESAKTIRFGECGTS